VRSSPTRKLVKWLSWSVATRRLRLNFAVWRRRNNGELHGNNVGQWKNRTVMNSGVAKARSVRAHVSVPNAGGHTRTRIQRKGVGAGRSVAPRGAIRNIRPRTEMADPSRITSMNATALLIGRNTAALGPRRTRTCHTWLGVVTRLLPGSIRCRTNNHSPFPLLRLYSTACRMLVTEAQAMNYHPPQTKISASASLDAGAPSGKGNALIGTVIETENGNETASGRVIGDAHTMKANVAKMRTERGRVEGRATLRLRLRMRIRLSGLGMGGLLLRMVGTEVEERGGVGSRRFLGSDRAS
jgi:hypothetical protein